jgi:hypothetical protein
MSRGPAESGVVVGQFLMFKELVRQFKERFSPPDQLHISGATHLLERVILRGVKFKLKGFR